MSELQIKSIQDEAKKGIELFVSNEEARYHQELSEIAKSIIEKGSRVILLAGPSSSGKTTSANLLSDELISHGYSSRVISLDDYYRSENEEDYPRTKEGKPDYESPLALSIPRIQETILHIVNQESFWIPHFNFQTKKIDPHVQLLSVPKKGCFIIEGLHALNPLITEGLPQELVEKIFVSVSTNINDGETRILSGRKIRFMRRLSRDYLYRNASCAYTLSLWPQVLLGEDENLYPYRHLATYNINTFHQYEIGVMKPYVEKLLADYGATTNEYLKMIQDALLQFDTIDEKYVPVDSLLREFIPGGKYEKLY